MSETEYCRLCDSPIASAYDSYCKAHDAEDEIIQLERQLAEAREEALKYKIKYNNQSSDILRLRQSKKDQTELIRKLKGKGDE